MKNRALDGPCSRPARWSDAYTAGGAIFVWSAWAAATLALILYIRHYTRNVPFFDDFTVVSVMTGHEPLSLQWAAAQYNEHRNVIPKMLLVTLLRGTRDFRAGLYLNAAFLSAAAASAIVMARRLRGKTTAIDVVLPLSILTIGHWECLMVGFALNLVMTSWISWRLIGLIGQTGILTDWLLCLRIGSLLVLLPLCGGSGIVMLPALLFWLAGYVCCGWWSGRDPGALARTIGLALLSATLAIIAWYLNGYVTPSHIPRAPSLTAIWLTTLQVFSLVVSPIDWGYWQVAGMGVVLLSAVTVVLLLSVVRRSPEQRPRALGLIAILLSISCVAVSVGISRSGMGPAAGLCSRYVTISVPLLGAVYIAWLLYGPRRVQRAIHISLLALICAGIPAQYRFARTMGEGRRQLYVNIERGLKRGMAPSRMLSLTYPALYVDRAATTRSFQMLKEAQVGNFRYMRDEELAIKVDGQTIIR